MRLQEQLWAPQGAGACGAWLEYLRQERAANTVATAKATTPAATAQRALLASFAVWRSASALTEIRDCVAHVLASALDYVVLRADNSSCCGGRFACGL